MTDMTDTEIAAAVAELTEAIRAKGYGSPSVCLVCQILQAKADHTPSWHASVGYDHYGVRQYVNGLDDGFDSATAAITAAVSAVDAIRGASPKHKAAEALRAAISAAREAGVDVGEIVGAGE